MARRTDPIGNDPINPNDARCEVTGDKHPEFYMRSTVFADSPACLACGKFFTWDTVERYWYIEE